MVYLSSQCGALVHRVIRIAQAFAVFPFRLKYNGLVLDPALLVYVLTMKLALGIHLLLVEEPSLYASSVLSYCAVVFHSIIVLFKKDKLNEFLRLLSDCEFRFIQLGTKSVIKTNDILDYFLVTSTVLTTLLESILHQDAIVANFFKISLRLSLLGVVHPFFHLVVVMQRRFSNLNEMIQDSSQYKASRFRHLTELHQQCITASITLNDCFTQQVLWITGALFLYIIITSYKVFIVIEADAGLLEVAIKTFNLIQSIFIAYMACAICEGTSMEARKFDILLHRLMIADVAGELVNDEKLFLHIAMRQELCFSAINVFALDYTLIHSMISAASTYLVILIQMNG
ncbi:unnamed protein product [Nezara viridula]|uniref:Gustatory receptor n=1 Tax=Nezara viridula TaxID=85310 RepID=A0A9P0GYZ0_NEZVI|nr:unnamed protein product [Nezara viridula]